MVLTRRAVLGGVCCAGVGFASGLALPSSAKSSPVPLPPGADAPAWAMQRFLSHWNCTQAVLESLAVQADISAEMITRITTPFAAGMWNGLTCGAATGVMMAIGMRYGRTQDGDAQATDVIKVKMRELIKAMTGQFGDLNCSALLGTDMATDAGVQEAASKGLFKSKCPLLVEAATREAARLMA
jgi:C_GCAxxG_C_C family probable redox protein